MPVSNPISIPSCPTFETSTPATPSTSAPCAFASPTGFNSEDVFEGSTAPSLDSVMAIQDPDKQRAQVKVLFSSLAESTALPKGEFRGDFVGLYTDSAIAKALVPWLWEGVEFDGPQATLSLNSWVSWFLPQETGTVSLAESVYDGRQTIRVDYEDRFWETRRLDDNRYLSIVTNKETNKIGDVHTLTVTR